MMIIVNTPYWDFDMLLCAVRLERFAFFCVQRTRKNGGGVG